MRVAILTRSNCRSPRFLAEGLRRMLARIGIAADCHFDALQDFAAIFNRDASRRNQLTASWAQLRNWMRRLDRYDVIVISDTVGIVGRTAMLDQLKALRRPILHYEVFSYSGCQYFVQQFGLIAHKWFDGFLVVSSIHDDSPLPGPEIFEVGMDLPILAPFQMARRFSALLDFPRNGYERERLAQKEALTSLGIPILELAGEHSFRGIDRIYAQAGVAFVAFPEAFGIPIVQLQMHGSKIAAPFSGWVKRHALRPPGHVFNDVDDASYFSDNFLLYRSVEELKDCLDALRARFDPERVRATLLAQQPQFVRGNLDTLKTAMDAFGR